MPALPEAELDAEETIDIGRLTRGELFVFLREHGLRGARRDTNTKLRAAARAVIAARGGADPDV